MVVNRWQVARIVALIVSFYGGMQVGLTEAPFALGFGEIGDVLMASVAPFLFMSICTYFAARRAVRNAEPRPSTSWMSSLVENWPLHVLHLAGYCALAISGGAMVGSLWAGNAMYLFAIFAAACGTGMLAGASLALR